MRLDTSDIADLKPIIAEAVRATLAEIQKAEVVMGDRLAFSEPEAAEKLGLAIHVLRDARLAGRIKAARCGRRVLYSRAALIDWLARGGSE
jgi:hypothetical protein